MAHLSHIGNSLGVRIPKAIIQQVGFKEDTDLFFKVTDDGLLISRSKQARAGWEEAFTSAGKQAKEHPLISEQITNEFDKDEWEW